MAETQARASAFDAAGARDGRGSAFFAGETRSADKGGFEAVGFGTVGAGLSSV